MANNNDNNNEPMTDAQLQAMRKRHWMNGLAWDEQRDLLAEVELDRSEVGRLRSANWELEKYIAALEAQLTAMREIVRVVAEADNSDSGVCYQLCNVRWYDGETWAENMEMRHDAPCIVEQARTLLAPHERQA